MTKINSRLGIAIWSIVVVSLTGAATSFALRSGNTSGAYQAAALPAEPASNAAIELLKTQLDNVAQYELGHGCVIQNDNGQRSFCGASKERVGALEKQLDEEIRKQELSQRSPEELAEVRKNIQALAEKNVAVTFMGNSANPYSHSALRVEHWQDDRGFLYLVNQTNNQVVQFGPAPNSNIAVERDGSKGLTAAMLQQVAEAYLLRHVADFRSVKANFSFRQLSKPGNVSHAFRWDGKTTPEGEDHPPFIQVVLSPAGEVMSFNDTRSLY